MPSRVSSTIRTEASHRCQELIAEGFDDDSPVLIDALPATGKSSGLVKWAAKTGNPLTVFTDRHELYRQYIDWAEEFGISLDRVKRLPSFHHDCPTANGDFGDDWKEMIRRRYNQGMSGKEIHQRAKSIFPDSLPCHQDQTCPYMERREYEAEDYDLLVGHYTHAYTSKPVENRYVAFDEFPEDDFLIEFNSTTVNRAISDQVSEVPVFKSGHASEFEDRVVGGEGETAEWVLEFWLDAEVPLDEWEAYGRYERDPSAATYVPVLIRTEYLGEKLDNGWRYREFPYGCVAARNPRNKNITVLVPPSLQNAESVIALDGTPTSAKWSMILGDELRIVSVHNSNRERNEFLKNGMGLRIIQTTTESKPYGNREGFHVTLDQDLALLEAIKTRERGQPALISSKAAIQKYMSEGLSEIIEEPAEYTDHYGNLKGKNEFGNQRLGVVIGCTHPRDDLVQLWAALTGHSVEAAKDRDGKRKRGMATDFGPHGNPYLRAYRELEVLQAAMRFGRQEDEVTGQRGATVYVHTAALPPWVEPEIQIADIHPWTGHRDGMKKVIQAIKELEGWQECEWRADEVKAAIDERHPNPKRRLSIQTVRSHLHTLSEYGYLKEARLSTRGRPYVWRNIRLEECGEFGHVEFVSGGGSGSEPSLRKVA